MQGCRPTGYMPVPVLERNARTSELAKESALCPQHRPFASSHHCLSTLRVGRGWLAVVLGSLLRHLSELALSEFCVYLSDKLEARYPTG